MKTNLTEIIQTANEEIFKKNNRVWLVDKDGRKTELHTPMKTLRFGLKGRKVEMRGEIFEEA